MKKNILLAITCLLVASLGSAQVLFEEDFNSYPAGHLNTDYTGTIAGQGGWVVYKSNINATVTAMVAPEAGKGNVLTMTTNDISSQYIIVQQDEGIFPALWNNRTAGNNVLKLEYEFYGSGSFFTRSGIGQSGGILVNGLLFISTTNNKYEILANHRNSGNAPTILKQYNVTTFPYNMWIKAELFIDYNTRKVYSYIPTLNLFRADDEIYYIALTKIMFNVSHLEPGTVVKYDNIKLSALQNVPAYIDALSAAEWVSSKFNLYPNPAANVVNITNSENMLVQQVAVYDIAGKQLSMQNFNNESEIQLNVENLASGVYMLHIETNKGTAVKKLVKR